MTGISAKILADSMAPGGERLTTVQATMPKWMVAQLNTNRILSKNSASSRAIPTSKVLEQVLNNPVLPVYWGKNQSGMRAQVELDWYEKEEAEYEIRKGANRMVDLVQRLADLGLHKQSANRYLEPWMWHTAIISATEWDNFFAQRDTWPDPEQPPGPAQPEFAVLARMIREAMEASTPRKLAAGEWHLPLVETADESSPLYVRREDVDDASTKPWEDHPLCAISAARCARVSYLTHEGKRDLRADLDLHDRLVSSGHWSPLEHVARAMDAPSPMSWSEEQAVFRAFGQRALDRMKAGIAAERWSGNFRGWVQYRKLFSGEHAGNAPGDDL